MAGAPSILLVDDEPDNLLTLEAVLSSLPVDFVRAGSGFEALRQLQRHDFAAILLDVQMPEMDGLETAAIIKRQRRSRDIPIIFVTGRRREPAAVARAYALGADALAELLAGSRRTFTIERRLLAADAATLWARVSVSLVRDSQGEPRHLICQIEDISERKRAELSQRRETEQRIAYLAYHDELTSLPNRAMFREHLDLALARAVRHGSATAVLYLDLDCFKLVNDSLGHAAGDEVLREAAGRL